MTPDNLDHECHRVPDDQLQYDAKFSHFIDSLNPGNYQTYAALRNIRKVRASIGMQGRSRSASHISGLKLEYYNHPSPNIVGQWINELDDGIELFLNEEIQSLTIWLTPMGFSTECPGMEVGQVAAIRIETTHSRSVTFRSPDYHLLSPRKLQHQFQGNSGEKLTAISWILNASSDAVRAVISDNGSMRTPILVPNQEPPFDQVLKVYFERPDGNGHKDTLVTVEVFFKDQAFVGLVFIYASGARVKIGEPEADDRQAICFPQDARITGLSVAGAEHELLELEFEVEQNEQPRYDRISRNSPHEPTSAIEYTWRDTWYQNETFAQSHPKALMHDRLYKAPSESRLVGIYVGCQDFSRVGALYDSEFSQ